MYKFGALIDDVAQSVAVAMVTHTPSVLVKLVWVTAPTKLIIS